MIFSQLLHFNLGYFNSCRHSHLSFYHDIACKVYTLFHAQKNTTVDDMLHELIFRCIQTHRPIEIVEKSKVFLEIISSLIFINEMLLKMGTFLAWALKLRLFPSRFFTSSIFDGVFTVLWISQIKFMKCIWRHLNTKNANVNALFEMKKMLRTACEQCARCMHWKMLISSSSMVISNARYIY